jgi:ABC-type arginine/histidine transport system permease subunit
MTSYYDMILGLIPVALFGIGGTLTLLGFSLAFAVPMAASVAIALIVHALFVNQPGATAQPVPETTSAAKQSTSISAD